MTDPITVARHQLERAQAETRQMRHEHDRLYDALEHTAQLAEVAGHEHLAAQLRRERHDVWDHAERGSCDEAGR